MKLKSITKIALFSLAITALFSCGNSKTEEETQKEKEELEQVDEFKKRDQEKLDSMKNELKKKGLELE